MSRKFMYCHNDCSKCSHKSAYYELNNGDMFFHCDVLGGLIKTKKGNILLIKGDVPGTYGAYTITKEGTIIRTVEV